MKATLILCDFAEEINGKVYIMGGGWTKLTRNPSSFAVALMLHIPWTHTNQPHNVVIRLVTEDGHLVHQDDGKPIELRAKVEVGRPPGIKPGTDFMAPLTVRFDNLPLPNALYRFEAEINGSVLATASFEAAGG